jgi:uncharacterized protein
MSYEWDEAKNAANVAKHGIGFETASQIFDGPIVSAEDTRRDYGEIRWNSIGRVAEIAVVVVTHTNRHGIVRIILARPANRTERKRYEEAIHKRAVP